MLPILVAAATFTSMPYSSPSPQYHYETEARIIERNSRALPPSLPAATDEAIDRLEARAVPVYPEAAVASPDIHYEYVWKSGFIGAGGDVEPPAISTLSAALSRCDMLTRCRGVTYEGAKDEGNKSLKVYFKMSDGVAGSKGWSAWVKRAPVTPPALTVAVGGTSRLELRLRQDFYSVQNLSRAGDTWSFTRPLDGASTLPNAAHMGDLSLRVGSTLFSTIACGAKATPVPLATAQREIAEAVRAAAAAAGDAKEAKTRSAGGADSSAPRTGQLLAAQNITALLASSAPHASLPLSVMRSYERSADGAALVMRFVLSSHSDQALELGGVGMALPESPGHPPAGIETVVWNDPHIGGERGFVEFVRVVDDEATLLVTAEEPKTTPFEAWRPMLEDLGGGDAYEWTVASKAWASEWATNRQFPFVNLSAALAKTYPPFARHAATPWPATDGQVGMPVLASTGSGAADPWNPPTALVLPPRGKVSLSLRFQLAPVGPRTRDTALQAMGAPLIKAVPGYVVPTDLAKPMLYVQPPSGATVTKVTPEPPTDGGASLEVVSRVATIADADARATAAADARATAGSGAADGGSFVGFVLKASGHGRVRVRVSFSDGTSATTHFFVLPPFRDQVTALGGHLADVAWLPRDYPDPFGRSASVMPWDRSTCTATGKACGHVLNDARAYDVGLSDDAGGGNPLCLASKVRAAPTAHEASRIDEFIQWTLYGVKPDTAKPPLKSLQIREDEGPNGTAPHNVDGVRMTMFYYSKNLSNASSGHFPWDYAEQDKCHKPFGGPTWCMTENMANATYRGFNYPHQISSYWAMYHVARHTTLKTRMSWQWYLYRAGKTCLKLGRAGVGFMDGTVAREVLEALLAEGKTPQPVGNQTFADLATTLRDNMKARQLHWAKTPYPYGSEFGFDTTGQEEVVVWNLYFGNESVARKTVDHVLSYMRNSPTWAFHGGARSWGDIGNNGKWLATFGTGASDRGQMHYRSGLNMIPLIEWYRRHPEEGTYLLEIAMGAIGGQMTNILPSTGETSMMFHSVPHMLAHDPHSGDYGLGFFGNSLESGSYYCGLFLSVQLPAAAHAEDGRRGGDGGGGASASLAVTFDADAPCEHLRLKLTKTAKARPGGAFAVAGASLVRGAYQITPAAAGKTTVVHVTYTA